MSISSSKPTISVLLAPWHRFHLWRAKRMYARVVQLHLEAKMIFRKANALTVKHSLAPLPLFDRLSEDPVTRMRKGEGQ